jgi:hypothetical protein
MKNLLNRVNFFVLQNSSPLFVVPIFLSLSFKNHYSELIQSRLFLRNFFEMIALEFSDAILGGDDCEIVRRGHSTF